MFSSAAIPVALMALSVEHMPFTVVAAELVSSVNVVPWGAMTQSSIGPPSTACCFAVQHSHGSSIVSHR